MRRDEEKREASSSESERQRWGAERPRVRGQANIGIHAWPGGAGLTRLGVPSATFMACPPQGITGARAGVVLPTRGLYDIRAMRASPFWRSPAERSPRRLRSWPRPGHPIFPVARGGARCYAPWVKELQRAEVITGCSAAHKPGGDQVSTGEGRQRLRAEVPGPRKSSGKTTTANTELALAA